MTNEDRHKAGSEMLQALLKWMQIKEKEGLVNKEFAQEFHHAIWVDAEHSLRGGLLGRLFIEQKEPLEEPPPCAMSRPWYGVIENEELEVTIEVWRRDDLFVVMQHHWKLIEIVAESETEAEYIATPIVGKRDRERTPYGNFRITRLTHNKSRTPKPGKSPLDPFQTWRFTREPGGEDDE